MNVKPKVRTQRINLRISKEEREILDARAKALNMTLSEYMLHMALA